MSDAFARIEWQSDRLTLDGFEYRFENGASGAPTADPNFFRFYKSVPLLEQYRRFWNLHPNFQIKNLLEIGIWDGASLAFWNDVFKPERHIGIDHLEQNASPYFQHFIETRGRQDAIRIFWQTDQADSIRLNEIATTNFDGPLDLVLDDGSHLYTPTRKSFETLFPLLREGGLYIIEDWAWAHWRMSHDPTHPFHKEIALTHLITESIEAAGTHPDPIRSVTVFQGFAAIEKGILEPNIGKPFNLDNQILRRPIPPFLSALKSLARTKFFKWLWHNPKK